MRAGSLLHNVLHSSRRIYHFKPRVLHCSYQTPTDIVDSSKNQSLYSEDRELNIFNYHSQKHNQSNASFLINMYVQKGCLEKAREVFDSMKVSERDVVIWSAMIKAYRDFQKQKEVLELFQQLQQEGVRPDEKLITYVLKAYCELGAIEDAVNLLFSMEDKLGIKPNGIHYSCILSVCADNGLFSIGKRLHDNFLNSKNKEDIYLKFGLIKMYGKCGHLEEAVRLFNSINLSRMNIQHLLTMMVIYGENKKVKRY